MAHLHSFTLTNEAHEIVQAWPRGSRSGNTSWAITTYDQQRARLREQLDREATLEKEIRTLKDNISGMQVLLTDLSQKRRWQDE